MLSNTSVNSSKLYQILWDLFEIRHTGLKIYIPLPDHPPPPPPGQVKQSIGQVDFGKNFLLILYEVIVKCKMVELWHVENIWIHQALGMFFGGFLFFFLPTASDSIVHVVILEHFFNHGGWLNIGDWIKWLPFCRQHLEHILLFCFFHIFFFFKKGPFCDWLVIGRGVGEWQFVNSLGPSDAKWRQISGSTLARVMACCLTAPSHYLSQCWLIISKVQWHSSKGKFTRDNPAINHWNYLEN